VRGAGWAARAAAAVALAALGGPAAAFVRGTTCSGDPQSGYGLWWGSRTVAFHLSSAHVPSGCADLPAADALVAQSFLTWNAATRAGEAQPCTDFTFVHGDTTPSILVGVSDRENVVAFRQGSCATVAPAGSACLTQGGCANQFNCWEHGDGSTLAITWVSFDTRNGQISDADVEIDDWDGVHSGSAAGFLYTCAGAGAPACSGRTDPRVPDCVYIDVGSVALHESGHVLGLDHPCAGPALCNPPAVLSPYIPPGVLRRTLYPDDVEGVCTVYPRGAAAAWVKLPGSCSGTRSCGCGGGPASGLWALLLPLLLRRSRRRRSPPRSSRPR
jgi:hypothetical protein